MEMVKKLKPKEKKMKEGKKIRKEMEGTKQTA